MSKIYTSADQLIGKTPLLELSHIEKAEKLEAKLLAKLEYFNPAGSVKDRIARQIIDAAEASGELKPGGTIVEGTSGNTGIALAMVGASRGYKVVLCMPASMSKERRAIMRAYEQGGHAYHATMPTGGLLELRSSMAEAESIGFEKLREQQIELGRRVREMLAEYGYPSVAAPGFEAPGVVVSHTTNDDVKTGKAFVAAGLQTAAGVPLQCDEPASFKTFRIGLFGLDKLGNIDRTVASLRAALDKVAG